MSRWRDANLRVLSVNLHVGMGLENGALEWAVERLNPHLMAIQEIGGRRWGGIEKAQRRLRKVGYAITPETIDGSSQTAIAYRLDRFDLRSTSDPLVSVGRSGMHPDRRRTTARLHDHVTGRRVVAHSVHTWTLGRKGWRSAPWLREGHIEQVRAIADSCERRAEDAVVLAAGDFNEHLPGRRLPHSAMRIMTEAGMVAAYEATGNFDGTGMHKPAPKAAMLDDVFVRADPHVRFVRRRVVTIPVRGMDHRSVLAVIRVAARPEAVERPVEPGLVEPGPVELGQPGLVEPVLVEPGRVQS